jgi:hypothetical protein
LTPAANWESTRGATNSNHLIEDLIKGIEADEKEIRPGLSNDLYEAWRESPDKAFELATSAVNA